MSYVIEDLYLEIKRLQKQIDLVKALHENSIDPDECMECNMSGDGHQLAPAGYPCRTLAILEGNES